MKCAVKLTSLSLLLFLTTVALTSSVQANDCRTDVHSELGGTLIAQCTKVLSSDTHEAGAPTQADVCVYSLNASEGHALGYGVFGSITFGDKVTHAVDTACVEAIGNFKDSKCKLKISNKSIRGSASRKYMGLWRGEEFDFNRKKNTLKLKDFTKVLVKFSKTIQLACEAY